MAKLLFIDPHFRERETEAHLMDLNENKYLKCFRVRGYVDEQFHHILAIIRETGPRYVIVDEFGHGKYLGDMVRKAFSEYKKHREEPVLRWPIFESPSKNPEPEPRKAVSKSDREVIDDTDTMRDLCIRQGYVPSTCTMPGQMIYLLTSKQVDACKGCNGNRAVCKGRPRE